MESCTRCLCLNKITKVRLQLPPELSPLQVSNIDRYFFEQARGPVQKAPPSGLRRDHGELQEMILASWADVSAAVTIGTDLTGAAMHSGSAVRIIL